MWGGINQEFGINTYTQLYTKQRKKQGPTVDTGNSTQYSVITYMGKEYGKEWMQVYIYLNHVAVHPKLTHCKSTLFQYKIKNKCEKVENK